MKPEPSTVPTDLPDAGSPLGGELVDEPRLSVSSAARRLGVAPATLRTWDRRYGIGPSAHTPGRHRRYRPDDVARLELMQHALVRGAGPAEAARYALAAPLPAQAPPTPSTPPPGDGPPELPRSAPLVRSAGAGNLGTRVGGRALRLPGASSRARGLGRAALALDASTARELLVESLTTVGVVETWDEVARPVLSAVADRWAYTGVGVEIEHLLSECVLGVLGGHVTGAPAAGGSRPVLLACMPGELHSLPLTALAAVLADRRIPCRSLGQDLPAVALAAAIRRTAPTAVVLWSQVPATADVALLRSLPRIRPRFRTFVAGPGWTGAEISPSVAVLESLAGAVDTIGGVASPAR